MSSLQELFEKAPPTALESEQAVICAMLIDASCVPKITAILDGPEDFSSPAHAAIYEAAVSVHSASGVSDIVSVAQKLRDMDIFDTVGGADYLAELCEMLPSSASAPHHAQIVREKARLRSAVEKAGSILDAVYNQNKDSATIAREALEGFGEMMPRESEPEEPKPDGMAAIALWDASPPEIRRIFRALKNPSDPRKKGILLSDPCKLLLAYVIAGIAASKKIRVSNEHMLSKAEEFYTNHFCFFVNNSGDSKTGTTGIIQEFIETFEESMPTGGLAPCLESGMATGPVLVIKDCFGSHDQRIKDRAIGTGMILPDLPGTKKDAEPRREVTAHDMREARESYKAEIWEKRDTIRPIIFVVDELAEKLSNVARIANGSLIDIHSSGPHVRIEGKYNGIGTCYGYGACISIIGNMQKALAADLFYNSRNASSGLQGRCLPLSNDFLADIIIGDNISASQEESAKFLANEFGAMPVNYIDARFPSFDDSELRALNAAHHGIEFNKFHVMTQRLLAPMFAWSEQDAILRAYDACLRLLIDLYPHAFRTGVEALSKAEESATGGKTEAIVKKKVQGKNDVRTRDVMMGFRGDERHGKRAEVEAILEKLGWEPYSTQNRPKENVGWRKKTK